MKTSGERLTTLKKELDFVEHGGYEKPVGTRQPLFCMESGTGWRQREFFEDSPVCPKEKYEACDPKSDCVLMGFVPEQLRGQKLPCHHIPLNENGDTIASLEDLGDREVIEDAIHSWVLKNLQDSKSPH